MFTEHRRHTSYIHIHTHLYIYTYLAHVSLFSVVYWITTGNGTKGRNQFQTFKQRKASTARRFMPPTVPENVNTTARLRVWMETIVSIWAPVEKDQEGRGKDGAHPAHTLWNMQVTARGWTQTSCCTHMHSHTHTQIYTSRVFCIFIEQ